MYIVHVSDNLTWLSHSALWSKLIKVYVNVKVRYTIKHCDIGNSGDQIKLHIVINFRGIMKLQAQIMN